MEQAIKDILNTSYYSDEDKLEKLKKLEESIETARKILKGEFCFCKECQDYYYAQSFFTDTKTEKQNICVYSDPINSGGDEYEWWNVKITYLSCPKGHKTILSEERVSKLK